MTTGKFLLRNVAKVAFLCTTQVLLLKLVQNPILSNEVALGQMENSDLGYMALQGYMAGRLWMRYAINLVYVFFYGKVGYNFVKSFAKKNKVSKDIKEDIENNNVEGDN